MSNRHRALKRRRYKLKIAVTAAKEIIKRMLANDDLPYLAGFDNSLPPGDFGKWYLGYFDSKNNENN